MNEGSTEIRERGGKVHMAQSSRGHRIEAELDPNEALAIGSALFASAMFAMRMRGVAKEAIFQAVQAAIGRVFKESFERPEEAKPEALAPQTSPGLSKVGGLAQFIPVQVAAPCGANLDRYGTPLVCLLPRGHRGEHNTCGDGTGDAWDDAWAGAEEVEP